MTLILSKIEQAVTAYNERKEALTKELKSSFPSLFKPIFDDSPEMQSFSWNQYSPYFNDGDECTFYVHEADIINDEYVSIYDKDYPFKKEFGQINGILSKIPDDFMEFMFGNHTTITVHRDGRIETTECDHD